ncbi:MAG: hypothetical protein ABJN69_02795 [Hellea sp.]
MSYVFDHDTAFTREQKMTALEHDIQRFTKACLSDWPRPVDYTNLIDAQHALKSLKLGQNLS